MRSVMRRIAERFSKVIRRTETNEHNTETCKHEWEVTGKDSEATANYQVVFHDTDYKCKLCGKTTDSIDHVHDH